MNTTIHSHPRTNRAQFSLRAILLVMTGIAVVFGIAVHCQSFPLAVLAALTFFAFFTWWVVRVSVSGIVFTSIGILLAIGDGMGEYRANDELEMLASSYVEGLCWLFSVAGVAAFASAAAREVRKRCSNMIASAIAMCVPLLCSLVVLPLAGSFRESRVAYERAQNISTMKQVVEEVEFIHAQLKHAPRNEVELIGALRKPLPVLGAGAGPIRYRMLSEDRFELTVVWGSDVYAYDSQTPNRGWVKTRF
ncbi:MAG: hypothetical protein ACYC35_19390 [Pirellulales bacterium]